MDNEELFPEHAEPIAPQAPPAAAPEPGVTAPPASQEPAPQAPPSPGEAQQHTVPLDVLLRTREEFNEKLRRTQAEAAELRQWREQQEAQRRAAAQQRPDIFRDPDAYEEWRDQREQERLQQLQYVFEDRIVQQTVAGSARWWRKELGDKWQALNEWITKQPAQWQQNVRFSDDPYGIAWEQFERVQQVQTAKTLQERLAGKDLDTWFNEEFERKLAEMQAGGPMRAPNGQFASRSTASPQPQPRPSAPSLANVNGAAMAPAPMPSEEEDFKNMFSR